MSWYRVENAADVYSPALLVYPDRIQANIQRMVAIAGDVSRLRPHVKTHKLAEVVKLQLAAGIDKFKVATVAEAEMVARAGAGDVLVAYPLVGPNARRFAELIGRFPEVRFSTLADSPQGVQGLETALAATGAKAEVLLELDVGMHRTGVAPGPAAAELYRLLAGQAHLRPGGFHLYDGHIRDRDLGERIAHAEAELAPALALRQELTAAGLSVPRLVCGGTPTFPVHARQKERELSPGTCLFWDEGYGTKFPDLPFEPAAAVLTRVVSKPTSNRLCLDLGYKAVASDNPDPRVRLLDLPDAKMVVHSEEHLVVETPAASRYSPGDELYGVPWHICPTCALYQEAVVVEAGRATGRWKVTARDRVLSV